MENRFSPCTHASLTPCAKHSLFLFRRGILLALCALAVALALLGPRLFRPPQPRVPQAVAAPQATRLVSFACKPYTPQFLSGQQEEMTLRPHAARTYYRYTLEQPNWQQDSGQFVTNELFQQLFQATMKRTGANDVRFCGGFWLQPQEGVRVAMLCLKPLFINAEPAEYPNNAVQLVSVHTDGYVQFVDVLPEPLDENLLLLQYPGFCHLLLPGAGTIYAWQAADGRRAGWQAAYQGDLSYEDGGVFLTHTQAPSFQAAFFCPEVGRYCGVGSYEIPFEDLWRILQDDPALLRARKLATWLAANQGPQESAFDCLRRTVVGCSMAWGRALLLQLADPLAPDYPAYTLQLTKEADGGWRFADTDYVYSPCFHYGADDAVVTDVDLADAVAHAADAPVDIQPWRALHTQDAPVGLRLLAQNADGSLRAQYSLASHAPALLLDNGTRVLRLDGPRGWVPDSDKAAFYARGGQTLFAMGIPKTYNPRLAQGALGRYTSEDLYFVLSQAGRVSQLAAQPLAERLLELLQFTEQDVAFGEQRISLPTALPDARRTPILQYTCTEQGVTAHLGLLLQDEVGNCQWLLEELLTAKVATKTNQRIAPTRAVLYAFCLQQPQLTQLRAPRSQSAQPQTALPEQLRPSGWPLQLAAEDCLAPVPTASLLPLTWPASERTFYRFFVQPMTWGDDANAFAEVLDAAAQAVRQTLLAPELRFTRGIWYDFDGDGRQEALVQLYGLFTDKRNVFLHGDSHMVYINAEGQAQYLYAANAENIECRLLRYPGFCHIHLTGGNQTMAGGSISYIYIPHQDHLVEGYTDYGTTLGTGVFVVGRGPQGIGPRYTFFSPELGQYCDVGYQDISPQEAWDLLQDSPALTKESSWLGEWLQEYRQPGESAFDCLRRMPCRYRLGGGEYLGILPEDGMAIGLCRGEDGRFVEIAYGPMMDYRAFWGRERALQLPDIRIADALARATTEPVAPAATAPATDSPDDARRIAQTLPALMQLTQQGQGLAVYAPFLWPKEGYLVQSEDHYYWLPANLPLILPEECAALPTSTATGGLPVLYTDAIDQDGPEDGSPFVVLAGQGASLVGHRLPQQQLTQAVLQQLGIHPQSDGIVLTFDGQNCFYPSGAQTPRHCQQHSLVMRYAITDRDITVYFTLYVKNEQSPEYPNAEEIADFATAHLTFADGVFTVSDFVLRDSTD